MADSRTIEITELEQLQSYVETLCGSARQRLDILTPNLEPRLYDREPVVASLRDLATSGRQASIRILIADGAAALQASPRLVELARQLTSFFELRRLAPADADFGEAAIIADGRSLLHRPLWTRHEATVDMNAPARARVLLETFDALWARATLDPETRRLHL